MESHKTKANLRDGPPTETQKLGEWPWSRQQRWLLWFWPLDKVPVDLTLCLCQEITGSHTAQKQEAIGFSLLLHQSCLNLAFPSQAGTAWFVIGSISDLFFKVTPLLKHDFIAPAVLRCPNVLGKPHSLWTVSRFFFSQTGNPPSFHSLRRLLQSIRLTQPLFLRGPLLTL